MVDLKPGNAYLFWGYRSYHATLPCRPGDSRATLIIHYGNLHRDSALLMGAMALGRRLRGLSRRVSAGAGSTRSSSAPPDNGCVRRSAASAQLGRFLLRYGTAHGTISGSKKLARPVSW